MTDVCLISMPFAAIERPSLALSLLKAGLREKQINSKVFYPNLFFAEEIGLDRYSWFTDSAKGFLLGEWIFSGAVFPDFEPDHEEYFRISGLDQESHIVHKAWEVRNQVFSFIERIAQTILDEEPQIVSCTSTFYQHCASLALLKKIRALEPRIITIMGGANCESIMGLTTLRAFPWVDFVCSGEGDKQFPDLCQRLLEKGKAIDSSEFPDGVLRSYNGGEKLLAKSSRRASVEDLNQVPIPDYDDYFQILRNSTLTHYITPGLPIETSRGCWWGQKQHCTFCGLNGEGMKYRSKLPDRVIQEIKNLSSRHQLRKFYIVDNILDIHHINTVMPELALLKEPVTLFYETKVNLNHHQLKQLRHAGVRWIQPGIESMHDEILKLLKKGNTALMNVQLLKWALQLGIDVSWNLLMKIPGERSEWYAQMAEWLPQIVHLQPPYSVGAIHVDRFSPYHMNFEDYGFVLKPNRAYSYIYDLPEPVLGDLVYYFEDQKELPSLVTREALLPFKEHRDIKEWVVQWKKTFSSSKSPTLNIFHKDDREIKILDTRPNTSHEELSLTGISYEIYTSCDAIQSRHELVRSLNSNHDRNITWKDIQAIVEELKFKQILLENSGKLLSLAVNEPVQSLMEFKDHPGGYVDMEHYILRKYNCWAPR